jgi:hypothetical protein
MSKPNKPTQEQIHRTLEAKQVVYLASGYSKAAASVWVKNWTATSDDGIDIFPEFGNWKSFEEIKDALARKIEEKYPAKAFPFIRLGKKITLYRRNDDDREYLWDMGDFDAEETDD